METWEDGAAERNSVLSPPFADFSAELLRLSFNCLGTTATTYFNG